MRRFAIVLWMLFCFACFTTVSYGQSLQVANGLSYLNSSQGGDGSWGGGATPAVERTAATVSVIECLKLLEQTYGTSYAKGVSWLQAQTPQSVAYVADRACVLGSAGESVSVLVAAIDRSLGGWGGYDQYATNILDTAAALRALKAANYSDITLQNAALAFLTNSQNADGGWGFTRGGRSEVYITATVSATLQQFPQMSSIASAVGRASAYLLAQQNADGSFGAPATPYETALALIALLGDGQTQGLPLQNAANYLTAAQSANGSWNDDHYSTALALKALHFSENRPAPPPPAPAGGTITGTVIDSVTQARVGGVAVALAGNSLLNTTTDSSGNFTLADVPPGAQSVDFAKPGYAARSASAGVTVGATTSLGNVPLLSSHSTGTIAGTISDSPGRPVAGVAISVTGAWSGSALTGADGSYSIPYVTPGEVTVTAAKSGYRTVAATAMVYARTTLSFSPSLSGTPAQSGTGTLIGRVIDSLWGVPMAPLEGEQGVRITLSNGVYAEPDSGGYFTISGIPPNTYQVIVGVDGSASQSFRVAIPAGAVIDLGTIRLESTISEMTLTGKVTDAVTGAPIPGAELTVSGSGLTGRTDFAGVYAIADIDHPSEFILKVSASGYVGKSFTVGSSAWLETMDVALTRQATKGSLAGAVVDAATGESIGGATLTLLSDPARSAATSGAGAFSIAELPQGMQQVRIAATGYTARVMTSAVVAGTINNVGRIPLSVNESAASIQGTVWDAVANAPFAGVAVESAAAALPQTSSAADGGYRFDNVTPGMVTVEAAAVGRSGYYPARLTGTLEPGGILVFNPVLTTAAPTAVDLSVHSEPSYRKGDTMAISVLLNNSEGSAYSTQLRVKILDPSGAAIFEEAAAVPLPADGALARDFSATLPASVQGGEYAIIAQLFDESGRNIGAGRRSFAVATSRIGVTPLLPAAFAAGANELAFKLVNSGELPVQSGTFRVTLKEPDGREVAAVSRTFSLGLGEEQTITATLAIPPLKFGTYTLSYTQSDETVNGLPTEIALPNSVAVAALYDSNSHRVRNSAGLTVVVANTGRFNLAAAGAGLHVAVAVPNAAYEETKTLLPAPAVGNSAGSTLLYSFVIPETMAAAQHGTRVTVTLPSGSSYTQNAQLSIPESSLSLSPLSSAYAAGSVIRPVIANDGGVDTTAQYRFSLYDARSVVIAERAGSEAVRAGSTSPMEIAIPPGAVEGNYHLVLNYKDLKTGREQAVTNALTITGVKGSLQLRTDKENYLLTESITGLSTVTNSGSELAGGSLHLEVLTGAGRQETRTWTSQADFRTGITDGVDVNGTNDWITPDDDFEAATLDTGRWYKTGVVTVSAGKALVDSSAENSGFYGNYHLIGDFDLQVDFSENISFDNGGGITVGGSSYYMGLHNILHGGYAGGYQIYGGANPWLSTGNTLSSGAFRFTRVGQTLTGYGLVGAGWRKIIELTDAVVPEPVTVGPNIYRGYPWLGANSCKYDNFILNQGVLKTAAQRVDSVRLLPLHDNFDDSFINPDRWSTQGSDAAGQPSGAGQLSESDGKLNLSLYNANVNDTVQSVGKTVFAGDYDMQVEWSDFSTNVDGSAMELTIGSDAENHASIRRYRSGAAYYYGRTVKVDGVPTGSGSVASSDAKGKFRITRSGSIVRTYYWRANAWIELGTGTASGTQPVTVALKLTMGGSGSASGKFDDFVAAGRRYQTSGSIKFRHDAGRISSWQSLSWTARKGAGTDVKLRTRTANAESDLQGAPWSDYLASSGLAISSPPGRWIEVEAVLSSSSTLATPLLDDVTVSYGNSPGDVIWQTDLPLTLASGEVSEASSAVGALGVAGKFHLQGTVTSATGQPVATAEFPFYVEQGNIQLTLAPDKRIYLPGEAVTLSGEVRNMSGTATNGVTVRVEGGGGAPHTVTLDLPAHGARPVSLTITAGSEGIYQFTGLLSQNAVVLASVVDKFEVAAPYMAAVFNAPDSTGSAPFNLSLAITNTGKVAASTRAVITDDGGNTLDDQVVTLAAGENRVLQYTRQISATTTYSVALSGDLDQTFAKKVIYLAPVIDSSVSGRIVVDKASYNPNEAVTLIATVSAASPKENLSTLVTVTNSAGQGIHSASSVIASLVQGQTVTSKSYWNSGSHPAGSYLVTLQILDAAGGVLNSATSPLVINSTTNPAALLRGRVTMAKQSILSGEEVNVAYEISNTGNVDLTDVALTLRTVDMTEERVYGSIPGQATLAVGASRSFGAAIDTRSYSAKDYLVVLSATIAGVEQTLAGSYFRVEGAPSVPALNGPAAGSDVETLTPALSVNNAADPNADSLSYHFELYRESGLTTLIGSATVAESAGSTSWSVPAPLEENGTYYWRARAYDGLLFGPWLAPVSFRVNTANDLPTAPGIAGPADGTAVSLFSPQLTVTNSADPDSASLTYNFEVALDPAFTQPVAAVRGVSAGDTTTSWTVPETLQENGTYFWRAQADDWLQEGPWTAATRFFVNTTNEAPAAPSILAPAAGSSVTALDPAVVIGNSSDPDSSSLSYHFEADTAPGFDSPEAIRSGGMPEGEGSTVWQLNGLKDNTRYYLRVKANDGTAESPWSQVTGIFVNTANDPPSTPTLANPSNGGAVSVAAPTLAVHNATDADNDVSSYEFELYADQAMTDLVSRISGVAETSVATAWQVPVTLEENGTYFWRARAFDGALQSEWMAQASFRVNTANDAPGAPVPVAPAEGETVATVLPVLAVNNAGDPEGDSLTYEFEITSAGSSVASVTGVTADASGTTTWTPATPLADRTVYEWRARANDGDSVGPWTPTWRFSVHLPQTSIGATLDLDPDTLNKSSQGTWVVAYLEFPAGYRPADADISSIRLQGTIPAESRPYAVGDYDKDGVPDLMVKFRRSELVKLVSEGESVPVQLTGKVGTKQFEAVDLIRVMR